MNKNMQKIVNEKVAYVHNVPIAYYTSYEGVRDGRKESGRGGGKEKKRRLHVA